MKTRFAVVEGQRREAEPGLKGDCLLCDQKMIAKCGKHVVWHWAHKSAHSCDAWWESETEWHRNWKYNFPKDWQEIIHRSDEGEKHIADVRTDREVVVEFQHSHLSPTERQSRESFYGKMVWVVDGLRRLQDRSQFFKALGNAEVVRARPLTFKLTSVRGALFRDWFPNCKPVFFDFGEELEPSCAPGFDVPFLWLLHPKGPSGHAYLTPVPKLNFVNTHLKGVKLNGFDFSSFVKQARTPNLPNLRPPQARPGGFEKYLAKKEKARSRIRF